MQEDNIGDLDTLLLFFLMHHASQPPCGPNWMQMVVRGWPTGGQHFRL